MDIVLASGSPRRRELLQMLKVKNLRVIPARSEERAPADLEPGELVKFLASHKAREVAALCGFGDYAGFYRAFRGEYGTSPRAFCASIQGQTSRFAKSQPEERTRI